MDELWNLKWWHTQFSSVAQSYLTLWSYGLQHARPPCPSPYPRACSNSYPWVRDAIQPSQPLSSPSPAAFNLSHHQGLFKSLSSLHHVAKVLGVSALASVLPMNIQDWFPLGLAGWFDLLEVQGILKNLLQHHSLKVSIFRRLAFFMVQLTSIRDY